MSHYSTIRSRIGILSLRETLIERKPGMENKDFELSSTTLESSLYRMVDQFYFLQR